MTETRRTGVDVSFDAAGLGTRATNDSMQLLTYLWAAPTTAVGLLLGALALLTGGRARRRQGALEIHGGAAAWLLRVTPARATAMTVGHIILGRHAAGLDRCRAHEQVHVRQAERWGPLFIPAYFGASLWALLAGRHAYRDNWFEIDARRRCGEESENQQTRSRQASASG